MKRTPLRRKTRLKAHSAKGQAYQDEYRRVSEIVLARANYGCEIRAAHDCSGEASPWPHHRQLRSDNGPNTPANLLAVCFKSHPVWIHQMLTRAEAVELGLIIPRGEEITRYE